jgi:hypothetical protein
MLTTMRRSHSALHLVLNVTAAFYYRVYALLPAPHRQSIHKLLYHGFVLHSDDKHWSSLPYLQDRLPTAPFEQGRHTYDVAISDMHVEFGCPGTHSTGLSSISFLAALYYYLYYLGELKIPTKYLNTLSHKEHQPY